MTRRGHDAASAHPNDEREGRQDNNPFHGAVSFSVECILVYHAQEALARRANGEALTNIGRKLWGEPLDNIQAVMACPMVSPLRLLGRNSGSPR